MSLYKTSTYSSIKVQRTTKKAFVQILTKLTKIP